MNAAFYIQWEVWKEAGYKDPELYDYTQENVFTFTKQQMIKFEKKLSQSTHLLETPYSDRVLVPEVDEDFISWCKDNL